MTDMNMPRMLRTCLTTCDAMRDGTPEETAIAELESAVPRSRWTSEPACRWEREALPGGKTARYVFVAEVWVR
jgi:hypothetical protein